MPENTIPHHQRSFLRSLALSTQPILTKLAHGSAPFISTFLLIHLSAPVLANLGGSSLSSQVMILGREYYQTSFGEKYLVLAPLFIHPLSGIFKRLLAPAPARRLSSILSITGYTAVAFVSMHFLVHRTFPADPAPPIFSVGPSELDYEYVKFALSEWPWRSWLGYVGLTACIAWHATEGMKIIWNTWLRKAFGPFNNDPVQDDSLENAQCGYTFKRCMLSREADTAAFLSACRYGWLSGDKCSHERIVKECWTVADRLTKCHLVLAMR
ncbi:hypothetical protein A0H81_04865 [Grifola frondosa]|uniref:Mitochondrial adapter protein MCP1 transmembrane domain-containing protein n=1 Tax=Grifola frondosa TaxID=5627 RepID=A0A1C7MFF8_GRIFR|nr:hypothetical protein A0H81_04865 [Grifola frondosa]